ncbi:MAG TPA: hypothetical protein VFK32_05440 [Tepidiformaceae bacterium]|nr:hypothetical protein [Tepidiformaceae bacterium]
MSNVDNLPELSIEEIATIMQILLEPTHIPRRTNGYLSSITRPSQARP